MKILIAAANFDRVQTIGSARPRSFAKWLTRLGHDVTVVARDSRNSLRPEEPVLGVQVLRVKASKLCRGPLARIRQLATSSAITTHRTPVSQTGATPAASGITPSRRAKLVETASLLVRILADSTWTLRAERATRVLWRQDFDVVISSYGPLASLWLGWRLSERAKAIWVLDYRDLLEQDTYPRLVNHLLAHHQTRSVAEADAVTAVSDGLRSRLQEQASFQSGGSKVHLLRNGFERTTDTSLAPSERSDTILRIGYTGQMYSGRRDSSALFESIKALRSSGRVSDQAIEIHYAGRDGAAFIGQAAAYDLEDAVTDHGFVSKPEAQRIQRMCDMLLVLSWNSVGQEGILTGKVFEYMQAGVPILALTGGDLPNAELSELVRELDLGFAYEYVNARNEARALQDYIARAAARRSSGEPLSTDSTSKIAPYHYLAIAEDLESICQDLVDRKARYL